MYRMVRQNAFFDLFERRGFFMQKIEERRKA